MSPRDRARECLAIALRFLRLGLTSLGGPAAHLEVFRREFVQRRGWLDARAYGGNPPGARRPPGLLDGLMLAAVAVVPHAVWGMVRSYAPPAAAG